jgi:hypothetical protein
MVWVHILRLFQCVVKFLPFLQHQVLQLMCGKFPICLDNFYLSYLHLHLYRSTCRLDYVDKWGGCYVQKILTFSETDQFNRVLIIWWMFGDASKKLSIIWWDWRFANSRHNGDLGKFWFDLFLTISYSNFKFIREGYRQFML